MWTNDMTLGGDRLANGLFPLPRRARRTIDAGIWNGHVRRRSYDQSSDVEDKTENGVGDYDTWDGGADQPHVPRQTTGEEKEGGL
jgi:hypothetical protein